MLRLLCFLFSFLFSFALVGTLWGSEEVPREDYLRYLPLSYPKLIRQTENSKKTHLDGRQPNLKKIATQFAPYLVMNTGTFPMSFQKLFAIQNGGDIHIDRWEVSGASPKLVEQRQVPLLQRNPGPKREANLKPDASLSTLLKDFDPFHPLDPWLSQPTVGPRNAPYHVLFFDFSGTGPDSWEKEYRDPKYVGTEKTYVHPFITDDFELALQYWFFYPYNDGSNDHEGDWEHINVIIVPRSKLQKKMTLTDVQEVLNMDPEGIDPSSNHDPLVIKKVDYYFHHFSMTLDYSSPNAYAPRQDWEAVLQVQAGGRKGETEIARAIRGRAWLDRDETAINTHPVVFIGADSKGPELILYAPGSKNRDGHGSYPFSGLYKNIGPVEAAEEIRRTFDPQDYFQKDRTSPEKLLPDFVIRFNRPDSIEMLPDWETVVGDPQWAWLLLPIRWGYPATVSPFAGIIGGADTGNLSPVAPSMNNGWNRPGPSAGYSPYEPHRLSGTFPLSPLDSIQNNLGYLNIPLIPIVTLPPFDALFKLILSPLSAALGGAQPIFYPAKDLPRRLGYFAIGTTTQILDPNEWVELFFNPVQLPELDARLTEAGATAGQASRVFANTPTVATAQLGLDIGRGFSSENIFYHSNSALGFDVISGTSARTVEVRGLLDLWEWSGAIRYNLIDGPIFPYLKVGYGLTWYRLTDVTTDSIPLQANESEWFRQPQLLRLKNVFPNFWNIGAGLEYTPRSTGPAQARGLHVGVKVDLTYTQHSLGLDLKGPASFGIDLPATSVHRFGFNFLGVISF